MNELPPPLVFIAGTDGAGKTCLTNWLVEHLASEQYRTSVVWSRFNNYLSKPLLALTRLTGHNYYKKIDGVLFGFHDFEGLHGFRQLFAALQGVDVNIAAYRDIKRKIKDYDVLVCERGPWDTLVDVISDTGLDSLESSVLGSLYTAQVRSHALVLLVSRSLENVLETRPELVHDRKLARRMEIYSRLAKRYHWSVVDNNGSLEDSKRQILHYLGLETEI